jgi:hypothetical protein
MTFTDSAGNEFIPGDIVRMFHFTGARKRKHYMYKRFLRYVERYEVTVLLYQSLDDENHYFTDFGNKLQSDMLIVQRAKYHEKDLKKNPKMRD